MNGYLVRCTDDTDTPRAIVGFFVAEDPEHLERLIDECRDADSCEYLEIGAGGIYWHRASYVVPQLSEDPDGEDIDSIPAGASVTESWQEPLYLERSDWVPITFSPDAANQP